MTPPQFRGLNLVPIALIWNLYYRYYYKDHRNSNDNRAGKENGLGRNRFHHSAANDGGHQPRLFDAPDFGKLERRRIRGLVSQNGTFEVDRISSQGHRFLSRASPQPRYFKTRSGKGFTITGFKEFTLFIFNPIEVNAS